MDALLSGTGSLVGRAPISSVSRYPRNIAERCEAKWEVVESTGDRVGKK
jgi:hypothetical protein